MKSTGARPIFCELQWLDLQIRHLDNCPRNGRQSDMYPPRYKLAEMKTLKEETLWIIPQWHHWFLIGWNTPSPAHYNADWQEPTWPLSRWHRHTFKITSNAWTQNSRGAPASFCIAVWINLQRNRVERSEEQLHNLYALALASLLYFIDLIHATTRVIWIPVS